MNNFTNNEYKLLEERLLSYRILEDIPEEIVDTLLKKFNTTPRDKSQEAIRVKYKQFDNLLNDYFNTILKMIDKEKELPYKINYSNIANNFGKSINTIKNHINRNTNLKYKYLKTQEKLKKQQEKKRKNNIKQIEEFDNKWFYNRKILND